VSPVDIDIHVDTPSADMNANADIDADINAPHVTVSGKAKKLKIPQGGFVDDEMFSIPVLQLDSEVLSPDESVEPEYVVGQHSLPHRKMKVPTSKLPKHRFILKPKYSADVIDSVETSVSIKPDFLGVNDMPESDISVSDVESSSQAESLPMAGPREFWAHSTTPELHKSYGIQRDSEDKSRNQDPTPKKTRTGINWPYLFWRRKGKNVPGSSSSGVCEGSPLQKREQKGNVSLQDEDLGIPEDMAGAILEHTHFSDSSRNHTVREKASEIEKPVKSKERSGKKLKPLPTDNESPVKLRKTSCGTQNSKEKMTRQTWHPDYGKSLLERRDSPPPPLPPTHNQLNADITEWLSKAYRRHHDNSSPLCKARPWSTLDVPPKNCEFRNDDHLFPYSITPTKLPSCATKEYNVPYIDDAALPDDELEWAVGESRHTMTMAAGDVSAWRKTIAEEERSGSSIDGSKSKSSQPKAHRSLMRFTKSKKPHHQSRRKKNYESHIFLDDQQQRPPVKESSSHLHPEVCSQRLTTKRML